MEGKTAVVITSGQRQGEMILDVVNGKLIGTLITQSGEEESSEPVHLLAEYGWSIVRYTYQLMRCFCL